MNIKLHDIVKINTDNLVAKGTVIHIYDDGYLSIEVITSSGSKIFDVSPNDVEIVNSENR